MGLPQNKSNYKIMHLALYGIIMTQETVSYVALYKKVNFFIETIK